MCGSKSFGIWMIRRRHCCRCRHRAAAITIAVVGTISILSFVSSRQRRQKKKQHKERNKKLFNSSVVHFTISSMIYTVDCHLQPRSHIDTMRLHASSSCIQRVHHHIREMEYPHVFLCYVQYMLLTVLLLLLRLLL